MNLKIILLGIFREHNEKCQKLIGKDMSVCRVKRYNTWFFFRILLLIPIDCLGKGQQNEEIEKESLLVTSPFISCINLIFRTMKNYHFSLFLFRFSLSSRFFKESNSFVRLQTLRSNSLICFLYIFPNRKLNICLKAFAISIKLACLTTFIYTSPSGNNPTTSSTKPIIPKPLSDLGIMYKIGFECLLLNKPFGMGKSFFE